MSNDRNLMFSYTASVYPNAGEFPSAARSLEERSLEGETFDPYSYTWKLSTKVTLQIQPLLDMVEPGLREGLIKTMCHYACTRRAATCIGMNSKLKDFFRRISPGAPYHVWRLTDLQNYREQIGLQFGNEVYLKGVRSFLKCWHNLRLPGVDRELYEALMEMRLKGSEIGRAVRSMDPKKGPLELTELHTLAKDLQSAYGRGEIDLEYFALCLFHVSSGRRPVQSANLKCKDLDDTRATDSEEFYFSVGAPKSPVPALLLMHVPRTKQHAATFRDEFRSIQWTSEFFAVFRMHQHRVQGEFEELLVANGWALQPQELTELRENLPLFPDRRRIKETLEALAPLLRSNQHGEALKALRATAAGEQWHRAGTSIRGLVQTAVRIAGTVSRTGETLSINLLRLRHTKGTSLAREGLGRDVIAWMLDHSTLGTVSIYTDNLPEHAIPANAAMALSPIMSNLAQLFRGRVVDREEHAVGGDDPRSSRIHFRGAGMATCGTCKGCGMGSRIPLCCYECDDFQPWLEGPHVEVLTELLEERRQREETLGADHPITRVADSTIVAVINVLQRCEVRRQELRTSL